MKDAGDQNENELITRQGGPLEMFVEADQAAQKKLWQKVDGNTQQQEDSCSRSVVIRGRAGDDMCNHLRSCCEKRTILTLFNLSH